VPNFTQIGQTVVEIWRFNCFFQNGGRPPSWICRERIGTIHEDYLVVFIVVLNLVGIAAVLFDNMKVLIFCAFGLKTPIHAPKIVFFWGGDLTLLVGSNINVTTKRH